MTGLAGIVTPCGLPPYNTRHDPLEFCGCHAHVHVGMLT